MSTLKRSTTLGRALPGAEFGSCFGRVIAAPPERVWEALFSVTVGDLVVSRPLILARYPWRRPAPDGLLTAPGGPAEPIYLDPPHSTCSGIAAKVWEPNQQRGPKFANLDELQAFSEPGWLKFGVDTQLTALEGGRTYLQTATLCEATDDSARAKFRAYWTLIRPFSAIIRLDLLRAVEKIAIKNPSNPPQRAGDHTLVGTSRDPSA